MYKYTDTIKLFSLKKRCSHITPGRCFKATPRIVIFNRIYISDTIPGMKKMNLVLITLIFVSISIMFAYLLSHNKEDLSYIRLKTAQNTFSQNTPLPTPSVTPNGLLLSPPPVTKILINNYYAKQTYNNCGPASLSMALSYYGINVSQKMLGESLRPYQNPSGDNDDKSVTLDELAFEAQKYNLLTYHKPNGDIELIKKFITYDIPIITRTWLHLNEDIGHYRVVKGYNENTQTIIQDDSYTGSDLSFSYEDFNTMWEKFDYEYLVLVPKDKQQIAESIIGKNLDDVYTWQQAVLRNEEKLRQNPSDIYARFNLSVAYYYLGEYKKSVDEFEKVENLLPFRTLWYQREPIEAYFKLGNYDKVFSITDSILSNYNRAYSELYILRGKIYKSQGDVTLAKTEFEKAVFYNQNLQEAKDLLNSI